MLVKAGITAAAGTRLALHQLLKECFTFIPFQSQYIMYCIVIFCHYLFIPKLGNLRACCLPQMWQPSLKLPLRNRTLIPRYPLQPPQSNTLPSKVDGAETLLNPLLLVGKQVNQLHILIIYLSVIRGPVSHKNVSPH